MIDLFSLQGKIALVTGATKGIGVGIAKALASRGAVIVTNNRSEAGRQEARAMYQKLGIDIHLYDCDVRDGEKIEQLVDQVEKEVGPIDILINNAGITLRQPAHELPDDDFRMVVDVNLTGTFLMSKYVARKMISRRKGKIINIASMMSELGRDTLAAYSASKGGVKMLTRNLATEWARYNIQVNGIGPGYFKTDLTAPLRAPGHPFNEFILNRTPASKWGDPEDLGGAAIFLASKASDFVNGQIIYVDGGILATIGKPVGEE